MNRHKFTLRPSYCQGKRRMMRIAAPKPVAGLESWPLLWKIIRFPFQKLYFSAVLRYFHNDHVWHQLYRSVSTLKNYETCSHICSLPSSCPYTIFIEVVKDIRDNINPVPMHHHYGVNVKLTLQEWATVAYPDVSSVEEKWTQNRSRLDRGDKTSNKYSIINPEDGIKSHTLKN